MNFKNPLNPLNPLITLTAEIAVTPVTKLAPINLKNLTDQILLENMKNLARYERGILTQILHHLREIEKRRLYSVLKYSSLFAYALGELKYSEAQADRRIRAMRLLRDLPESESNQIETKINSGSLSLTNVVLAQSLFSKERAAGRPLETQSKVEFLRRLENLSTRDAQKLACEVNPSMKLKSQELNFDSIRDDKLREKLLRVKGLFAHINPNMNLGELLNRLCDNELEKKLKPKMKGEMREKTRSDSQISKSPSAPKVNSLAEIKRQVWRRDNGQCTNCKSTFALQVDHKFPRALGGENTLENFRLLCRNCNQRAAIQIFGVSKMGKYLNV
jgi:hypothetical protein